MAGKSYFTILGISVDADTEEIKNAYRRLAHRYHPDHGEGDSRRFRELQEAYHALLDPEQRRRHRRRQSEGATGGERVPVRVVRSGEGPAPRQQRGGDREHLRPARRGVADVEHIAPSFRRSDRSRRDLGRDFGRDFGPGPGASRRDPFAEFEELFDRLFREFF